MKKGLIKLWISISLWIEDILGIYRDVSSSSQIFEGKEKYKLYQELNDVIFILNIGYDNTILKREKLLSNKLSGIILAHIRNSGYKRLSYPTGDIKKLKEQIQDCFKISIEEVELGYRYKDLTRSVWSLKGSDNLKKKIILALITLEEGE